MMSTPWSRLTRAVVSISKVLPTPGAAPRKILRRPRDSFATCCSSASGEGLFSRLARSSLNSACRRLRSPSGYRDPARLSPACWNLAAGEGIQRQVQLQHVHMRFAKQAQEPALDVVDNELADLVFGQVARLGHAGHLEIGAGRRDIRIEPAGR